MFILIYAYINIMNRAEEYDVYKESINNGSSATEIGVPIILPSSFTGGPRSQSQLYQDNMALVRKYGKVSLFSIHYYIIS
jgi:hypothetical protein